MARFEKRCGVVDSYAKAVGSRNIRQEVITPPLIATIVFALGILGVFWLDRDEKARTSKALWIPVIWLWILASRELSQWLAAFGMMQAVPWSTSAELEGNPVDQILYIGLLICGVIVLVRRGQEAGPLLRANLPIVLFFLHCAQSVLWSDYPEASFKRWIKSLGDVVMVMVVLTDPDRLAAIKRLLARTSFLVIPLSILVIKFYPELSVKYRLEDGKRIITGLALDKNALGVACLILGLGCLWRFIVAYQDREGTHRTRHLIVHGTLLVMVMWLFLKANSVTSLLCFVLVSGLLVATSIPPLAQKRAVLNLLVVTALVAVVLPLFLGTGTDLLRTVERDATLTGRTDIWKQALAIHTSPILGAGFESFWLAGPLDGPKYGRSWHVNEAHNGYLEVYLNLGMVGVVLLAFIIVTGYRNAIGMFPRDPREGRLRLVFLVVALTYSCSEAGFRMMSLVWICFLLAAIAVPNRSVPRISGARVEPLAAGTSLRNESRIGAQRGPQGVFLV